MENLNIDSTSKIALDLMKKRKVLVSAWVVAGAGIMSLGMINWDWEFAVIGFWAILAGLIYFLYKAQSEFMQNFAKLNKMTYSLVWDVNDLRSSVFQQGSGMASNMVFGSWNNFLVKIFNYSDTRGYGKHKVYKPFTVLEINFEKIEFPFIFLKSKSMWNICSLYEGGTNVSISSEKFKLETAKGYEIEALQIFSEELLKYLEKNTPNFSIEFAADKINIFDDKIIATQKELSLLFDVGKYVIDSSGAFISRLHDDFNALHPYFKKI